MVEMGYAVLVSDIGGGHAAPRAPGSPLAVDYLWNAIRFTQDHNHIDPKRVYLVGAGGGGLTVLKLLERYPHKPFWGSGRGKDAWAGVILVDSVTDLKALHEELTNAGKKEQAARLNSFLSGAPTDPAAAVRYKNWSATGQKEEVLGQKMAFYLTLQPQKKTVQKHHNRWLEGLLERVVGTTSPVTMEKFRDFVWSKVTRDRAETWSDELYSTYGVFALWLTRPGSSPDWKQRLTSLGKEATPTDAPK